MLVLICCAIILLYGLFRYTNGRKGDGALVFFFFLTGGFHFLNQDWCPVKYLDFAVVYLLAVATLNVLKGNFSFFKPQIKIYKVVTFVGVFITIEFIRTVLLKEEYLSFAFSNYRTYLPFFSFWIAQELNEREVKRLFKQIAVITIISTVLFDLQPLLHIRILQHAKTFETRYRNIPFLAYFFMLLATVRLDFKKWKTVLLVLVFVMAVVLTKHRAVMIGYVLCIGLYLLMSKKVGNYFQYGIIGLAVFLLAGETIVNRFENASNKGSTLEDIKTVINLDYSTAIYREYEDVNGTLSFRVLLFMERVDYMINNPRYTVFGIGTRHEDSPKTKRQFDFVLGSHRSSNDTIGQISSGDLAWLKPLMRFGFFGIALFLYMSWVILSFFYKNRRISDVTMTAFLFYMFLIIISFKNDHLYGNMQMFFIYLLIEYIRYAQFKIKDQ